jgi:L-fuculose-phosphate aldolase
VPAPTLRASREAIVRVCRRLYAQGLIAGQDGNVSVRLPGNRILVTPAGMTKADLRAADLVVLSTDGSRVSGRGEPSSEVAVHLEIYAGRPDVGAVVHAHPPAATGFAVAGETLPPNVLPELVYTVGPVGLVPYERPGTTKLARRFRPLLAGHNAWLMANHGAVTAGPTLSVAHQRMESLEHAAKILFVARAVGRVVPLPEEE